MELLLHGSLSLFFLLVGVLGVAVMLVRSVPTCPIFPKWVVVWLTVSSLICIWDALFVLLRPASFDILLWAPYLDYIQVDKLYANVTDSFVWSQSIMNLVEVSLNLYALSLLWRNQFRAATVLAVAVSAMTSAKTVIYHVMEYACGFCNSSHNDSFTFVVLYLLPNGIWIWVPAFVAYYLGNKLVLDGHNPARSAKKEQ